MKIPLIGGMDRKQVLLIALVVIAFFCGSFVLSVLFTQPEPKSRTPDEAVAQVKEREFQADNGYTSSLAKLERLMPAESQLLDMQKLFAEKQAQQEIREKQLDAREQRILLSEQSLQQQAQSLQDESIRLDAVVKRIRQARDELERTRIEYARQERIAAQKEAEMLQNEPERAAASLTSLWQQGQFKMALLILDNMDEKRAGRVLAAFEDTKLVAQILEKLPKLQEKAAPAP